MTETNTRHERLALWVAKLRSGEYKQAEGQLRRKDGNGDLCFCCLGVACDIAPFGDWLGDAYEIPPTSELLDRFNFWQSAEGPQPLDSTTALPEPVADWLGFTEDETNPMFKLPPERLEEVRVKFEDQEYESEAFTEEGCISAVDMNDLMGWSFATIADVVEWNMEEGHL